MEPTIWLQRWSANYQSGQIRRDGEWRGSFLIDWDPDRHALTLTVRRVGDYLPSTVGNYQTMDTARTALLAHFRA